MCVCEHTRLLSGRRFVLFIISCSLIIHVKGSERVEKKELSSFYPHSRWQERRERETWFTYSIGGATTTIMFLFLYFDHLLTTFLPGVFFSIDEREKLLRNTRWIEESEYERIHTAYGVLSCVKSCLGWWLFTFFSLRSPFHSPSFSFHLPEILIRQHLLNNEKERRRNRQRWRREGMNT